MSFILDTGDGTVTNELTDEEVRETAAERRQRRMKEKLEKAKLRKKALFDSEYDATGNNADGKTYFDELKSKMELQAKVGVCEYFRSYFIVFYNVLFASDQQIRHCLHHRKKKKNVRLDQVHCTGAHPH